MTKIMTFSEEIFDFDRYDSHLDIRRYENFLREKLTSALSEARQEGREEGKREAYMDALILVDRHDPNIGMGRETSTLYWGNTLRNALLALTTEGK